MKRQATRVVEAGVLRRMFRQMLRIRMVEEKIVELYPEQEMRCPVHLCVGQEAVAVGVCTGLASSDYVLSGHRSHGHYLAKGGDLSGLMAELFGKAGGCSRGKGGSMHLVDLAAGFLGAVPIVGSTIPIAVGAAWGSRMRGEERVVVSFFGEAAVEEGVFHESINFAALKQLPIVFVCENNLYSVYTPLAARQPEGREVVELARGHGVNSWQGDGNDAVEVYTLAQQAIDRAREGGGPSFLEFKTYRWREHCGPFYDNDLGYRTEAEFEAWKTRCPVERMREHVLTGGVLSEEELKQLTTELEREVETAVAFGKSSPFPAREAAPAHVYRKSPGAAE